MQLIRRSSEQLFKLKVNPLRFMKSSFIIAFLLISALVYSQESMDSTTTEWESVGYNSTDNGDSVFMEGAFIFLNDTALVPSKYTAVKVQHRRTNEGKVEHRFRYYFIKK